VEHRSSAPGRGSVRPRTPFVARSATTLYPQACRRPPNRRALRLRRDTKAGRGRVSRCGTRAHTNAALWRSEDPPKGDIGGSLHRPTCPRADSAWFTEGLAREGKPTAPPCPRAWHMRYSRAARAASPNLCAGRNPSREEGIMERLKFYIGGKW